MVLGVPEYEAEEEGAGYDTGGEDVSVDGKDRGLYDRVMI